MEKGLTGTYPAAVFAVQEQYEYLLVLHPSAEAYTQLMQEKQHFFDTYKEKVSIKTMPHITIASFTAKELMEETIIRYMQRIFSGTKRFTVTLNNFSGFPPHTVYVRVQDHKPFKQLAASLTAIDQYVRSNGFPPTKFVSHPHVDIARRLRPEVYEKAMFEFSQRSFYTAFAVDELLLLKRQTRFDKSRQVNVFKLL